MIEIPAKLVMELHVRTGLGVMDCKRALVKTEGDIEKAVYIVLGYEVPIWPLPIPETGNEGFIAVYTSQHQNVVATVELACLTGFVAHSEGFRTVANGLAAQVAVTAPLAIVVDDLPEAVRSEEEGRVRAQWAAESSEADVPAFEEMVQRNLEARCLLTQPYLRNTDVSVGDILDQLARATGEAVYVRRIARWQVGEAV